MAGLIGVTALDPDRRSAYDWGRFILWRAATEAQLDAARIYFELWRRDRGAFADDGADAPRRAEAA